MKPNTPEIFWSRVLKTESCWLWMAGKDAKGYGVAYLHGQHHAHRLSWRLTKGAVPSGMDVLHHCDNPPCVNPEHLWLGTHRDNMADRDRKGRLAYGERMGPAKLSNAQVTEIRNLHVPGQYGFRKLARRFGVSRQHIASIVKREWRLRG